MATLKENKKTVVEVVLTLTEEEADGLAKFFHVAPRTTELHGLSALAKLIEPYRIPF